MEVVLVRFVGAGLALALSGHTARIPRHCIPEGLALVAQLSGYSGALLRTLLDMSARDILQGWRQGHVPDAVAVQHMETLPALVEKHGPSSEDWAHALSLLPANGLRRKLADGLAQELAADTVAAASSAGAIQRSALLVQVSMTLLHRLFAAMLSHDDDVKALLPVAERLFDPLAAGTGEALQFAMARYAPSLCPQALLEALVKADQAKGIPDADIAAQVEGRAYVCQELMKEAKAFKDLQFDPIRIADAEDILACLTAGDIASADDKLTQLEDQGRPVLDLADGSSGDKEAMLLRMLRAKLNEAQGDFLGAARHYGFARRFCPTYDVRGRWQVMMRQAAALSRHGIHTGEIKSLFEAAQVHAEAGGLLQEQDAPMEWATAHVELGNLLLNLAEHEGRPERYLAAGLHFKPAVDVFSKLGATDDWALAQLGLAHALKGQGEHQGDPVILGDAAFAYRAAIGMLHRGRAPADWTAAHAGLGSSLVRIAEETGQSGLMDEAITSLKSALASMKRSEAKPLEAALGRAYVVLAAEKDDISALQNAVDRLNRALEPSTPAIPDDEQAMLVRLLGSSLWALAEAAGDRAGLETALSTLKSARERFEKLADEERAQSVAKEIATLDATLVRLRRAQRHAATVARERQS